MTLRAAVQCAHRRGTSRVRLPGSIRARLLLSATAVLLGFALALTLALQAAYEATLAEALRRRLEADARTMLAIVRVREGELVVLGLLQYARFSRVESDLIALIYDEAGELIWRSPSATDFHPDYHPRFRSGEREFRRIHAAGGRDYFIRDLDIRLGGRGYSIITGDTADEFDLSLRTYRQQLLIWLGGSIAGLVLLLGGVLAWALRPLRDLRRQLRAIQHGDGDELSGDFPDEVAGLARALNQLLAVEHARQARYRETLTELAHGLKTPLAVMAEVAEQVAAGEQRETLKGQIQRMDQQISYQLQRTVPGAGGLVPQPLPLAPALARLCEALDKVYRDKQVRWQLAVGDVRLLLSEAQALELFGNLLENAFRLCLQEVRITATALPEGLLIAVDDDGPGVPLALRERILERGLRADSRHAGQGIGLAVVVDLLRQLQASIEIDDSPLGGASFRLRLPSAAVG